MKKHEINVMAVGKSAQTKDTGRAIFLRRFCKLKSEKKWMPLNLPCPRLLRRPLLSDEELIGIISNICKFAVYNAISTLPWTDCNSRWYLRNISDTLVDLLGTAGRRPYLPMVVCCSTRDELDAVCSNISNLSSCISVSALYSDLSEAHRAEVLDNFRQATMRWNRLGREEDADGEAEKEEEQKSHVIVVTDACLPLLGSELPVCARILINYELPTKKETYMRRMSACLSAGLSSIGGV
ncbi:hypothetical protein DH2020_037288 [Rehmannia glutinosa]|uniref:Uncharacterized protein n=1 Tax=Rehmannia glutinosa TaxID=99300 RepID=A0ABR0V4H9_REHGL